MPLNSSCIEFAEILTRKLQIEERIIHTGKMTHLAKEICDMLRQIKYLGNNEENDENIKINRLAYSKMIIHRLLLCHGFSLVGNIQFNALDDGVLEFQYKLCYRDDYDYQVEFKGAAGFVKINVTRVLSNPPINPQTGEVSGNAPVMVCAPIAVLPTFANESLIQDYYTTEKILINIIKTFSKLWTNFRNTTEPPTPAEDDME